MTKENANVNKINCHAELDSASLMRFRIKSGMTEESGRSMVEMLGVLAIIGLLTIIGIAGFKIAMNKAKANNLVADMNRLAHIVVMDKFSGYSEEAIENAVAEHNEKTEYPAEYEYRTPQVFAIKIKNAIDKALCQQVANLGWNLPIATFVNNIQVEGKFNASACSESNLLTWIFTNDLSACTDCPLGDFDCTPYENAACGTCNSIAYTPNNGDCNGNANGEYCLDGQCVPCGPNSFRNGNNCSACSNKGAVFTSATYRRACLSTMYYSYDRGALYGCLLTENFPNTDEISCKACENRCFEPSDGSCQLAGDDRPYHRKSAKNATCVCKNLVDGQCLCPENSFLTGARCGSCSRSGGAFTSETYRHACLSTMFYSNANRALYGCRENNTFPNTDETSCKECTNNEGVKNRCFDANDNNTCRLIGNGYARDDEGNCVSTQ